MTFDDTIPDQRMNPPLDPPVNPIRQNQLEAAQCTLDRYADELAKFNERINDMIFFIDAQVANGILTYHDRSAFDVLTEVLFETEDKFAEAVKTFKEESK